MVLLSALILGLAGSLHCVAMCGPLLLSITLSKKVQREIRRQMILHHTGRILGYGVMGLFAGYGGELLAAGGFQQKLAIVSGVLLLFILFAPKIFASSNNKLSNFIKRKWARLLRLSGVRGNLMLGLLNSLLPCGLVYSALAAAAVSGTALSGALFMMIFGLGTLPLLAAVSLGGAGLKGKFKGLSAIVIPLATCATALFLIVRGLALDIPYLSPALDTEKNAPVCCPE